MELDYSEIGRRVARRRKELGLRQVEVCERAGINDKYLSCIERATSIPSLEVIMRLALALDTTPDAFLTGSVRYSDDEWRDIAELMRGMNTTVFGVPGVVRIFVIGICWSFGVAFAGDIILGTKVFSLCLIAYNTAQNTGNGIGQVAAGHCNANKQRDADDEQ